MSRFFRFAFFLALTRWIASPVSAQAQCVLTADPVLIRADGLAERVGTVQLNCQGTPGQPVTGSIQLGLDTRLANRVSTGGLLPEVQMEISSGAGWVPVGIPARLGVNAAVFDGLSLAYDALGRFALRISGLRGEAQPEVRAFFSPGSAASLPVPNPFVVVAFARDGLAAGFVSGAPRHAPESPEPAAFSWLAGSGAGLVTLRVTEANAPALGGAANPGTRLLVRFPDTPPGATVWIPDAVAGSNALLPTSGGQMSLPPSGGAWQVTTPPTLLLARVEGADARGQGGQTVFTPQPGINSLERFSPAARADGVAFAVYEVLSSDPATLEFAEIPAFLTLPRGWRGDLHLVIPEVRLAPLSELSGPSETAPVPRFRDGAPPADCLLLNDCAAPYFPRILFQLNGSEDSFSLPSGTVSPNQFSAVRSTAAVPAAWRATVEYENGADWIRLHSSEGIGTWGVAFFYDTRGLAPGVYRARLVATVLNGPVGLPLRESIPLTLTVTPAQGGGPAPVPPKPEPPQPQPPRPLIRDVVNAANRIPGPLAPGSLVLIAGELFGEAPEVRFGSLPARIYSASGQELLVEAPMGLEAGQRVPVVVLNGAVSSGAFVVEIAPAAPAIFRALNEDGRLNSAEHPAATGARLQIVATGIRQAFGNLYVLLHDRRIEEVQRVELDPPLPGADVLSLVIPGDLPPMSTAVTVCASSPPICAEPFDIWLRNP